MVARREPEYMTVEEWRELERNSYDIKHEYIDGRVYAMMGGSLSHSRIGSNTSRILEDMLGANDKLCYVYNSSVATRLSPIRYTYPDVVVSCDERDQPSDKTEVEFPRVIVEVLSDSTEAFDRGHKFALYRACPTIQEYMLVATKYQAVEVYRRTVKGWTNIEFYEPSDEIELTSLGIHVPMNVLYKGAGISNKIEEPEGEF